MIKIVLVNLGFGEWGQNNFKLIFNEQYDIKIVDKKEFLNLFRNSDTVSRLISKCLCEIKRLYNGKQEETL